jgi:hypothetical protein
MSNAGYIHIRSELNVPRETHDHRCPICRKIRTENNAICRKQLRGTGLINHAFPCYLCAADWRCRFGIEVIIDSYLSMEQARRFRHEWPDEKLAAREINEARAGEPEVAEVVKEPSG